MIIRVTLHLFLGFAIKKGSRRVTLIQPPPLMEPDGGLSLFDAIPLPIICDHIIAQMDDETKLKFLRLNRVCFTHTVSVLRLPEDTESALLPLVGPALKRLVVPDATIPSEADFVALLGRCIHPIRISMEVLFRTPASPEEQALKVRLLRTLLHHPMVREVSVRCMNALNEDACALLAHPKFAVSQCSILSLCDVRLPPYQVAALRESTHLSCLALIPFRSHHLELLTPRIDALIISPHGASPEVGAEMRRSLTAWATSRDAVDTLQIACHNAVDVTLLTSILQADVPFYKLDVTLTGISELSPEIEDAFYLAISNVDVLQALLVDFRDTVFREPDRAACMVLNAFALCRCIILHCSTPDKCFKAIYFPAGNSAEMSLTAKPRVDGTGPRTDEWMWHSMANAYQVGADAAPHYARLVLSGGCEDNGLTRLQRARTAGRRMALTNIGEICIIFRCSDASWMAPFIQGFVVGYGQRTHAVAVVLFAGGGDEGYFDGHEEDYDDNDEPGSPAIAAAIEAASLAMPLVRWKCIQWT